MKKSFNFHSAAVFVAVTLMLVVTSASAEVKTDTAIWTEYTQDSQTKVDHSAWQAILNTYLDDEHPSGVSRFDYGAVSDEDKDTLFAYLDSLQAVDPSSLTKDEQKAYWINFYNSGTVRVILENYPVKSIRNIRPKLLALSLGPWDHPYFAVNDKELTLNDIEHGILRPIWKDPRLHFVLNCASIGCPNLLKSAFTVDNVENQLEAATEAFLMHPRAVSLEGSTLMLSSLFDWYAGDFGSNQSEIFEFISDYSDLEEISDGPQGINVKYHYDWNLNDK